jgi:rubredoxin
MMKKGLVFGIVILFLLVSFSVIPTIGIKVEENDPQPGHVILHDLYGPDTYVSHQYPEENYANSKVIRISNEYGVDGSPGWANVAYVTYKHDLMMLCGHNAKLEFAELYFYYDGYENTDPVDRDLNIYRVTENWDDDTLTWDNQPAYNPEPLTSAKVLSSTGDWIIWDVTDDVQNYLDVWPPESYHYGYRISDDSYWGESDIPTTMVRSLESDVEKYHPVLLVGVKTGGNQQTSQQSTTSSSSQNVMSIVPSTSGLSVDNDCLCQDNVENDFTLDQLDSFERVNEHGHCLMQDFDDNWEQQKRGAPSGTSTVCGYVTDEHTGLPLENVKVEIKRYGQQWISTYTDSTGYYSKILPPTYSISLHVHADGYLITYYCCYVLYENKTVWVNMSLYPRLPESSIVYGYVTDKYTGDPVENAEVKLEWRNDDGHYNNYTYTDYLGFYSMNVAAGEMKMISYHEDYFPGCWDWGWSNLGENKTRWGNISAHPRPTENSVIYGYIYDEKTGDPLENAEVEFDWNCGYKPDYTNITYTDSLGYYSINAAAGKVRVEARKNGYFDKSSSVWILGENETAWVNLSLEPHPPENSVVCGYITDAFTSEPIELAKLELNWEEYTEWRPWNKTFTGISGFYKMNLPAGEFYIDLVARGYFWEVTDLYNITENETIWLNISMYQVPHRSSVVCGYVTDEDSGEPLVDIWPELNWRDPYGHTISDWNQTNESGFYSFNIFAGEIQLEVWDYHYFSYSSGWITIGENEVLWINFTLKLDNTPPHYPYIAGPSHGKPGEELRYTFSTYDFHRDDVYYYIDWGDGNITDWIGPYDHEANVALYHTWSKVGIYYIRAKAKDVYGYESEWGVAGVSIPRDKATFNLLFLKLLEQFPILERLLSLI